MNTRRSFFRSLGASILGVAAAVYAPGLIRSDGPGSEQEVVPVKFAGWMWENNTWHYRGLTREELLEMFQRQIDRASFQAPISRETETTLFVDGRPELKN